jgi:hypothetical protein
MKSPSMAMFDMSTSTMNEPRHELRFRPLLDAARVYAFPCDAKGKVDLDALSDRERNDYFYARALVGHAYRMPVVEVTVAGTMDDRWHANRHAVCNVAARIDG